MIPNRVYWTISHHDGVCAVTDAFGAVAAQLYSCATLPQHPQWTGLYEGHAARVAANEMGVKQYVMWLRVDNRTAHQYGVGMTNEIKSYVRSVRKRAVQRKLSCSVYFALRRRAAKNMKRPSHDKLQRRVKGPLARVVVGQLGGKLA